MLTVADYLILFFQNFYNEVVFSYTHDPLIYLRSLSEQFPCKLLFICSALFVGVFLSLL